MSKKILIIEDSECLQKSWRTAFGDLADEKGEPVELLQALTIYDGNTLFRDNMGTIDLIGMDACVPGDIPNTLDITRSLSISRRYGFVGPIVAMSGDSNYRKRQVEAGCNHECEKSRFVKKVMEILNLRYK